MFDFKHPMRFFVRPPSQRSNLSAKRTPPRQAVTPTTHQPKADLVPLGALKRGDIILFGPDGTIGAWLIQVATISHYHHVAIYDGKNAVIQAMPAGVGRAPLTTAPLSRSELVGLRPKVSRWRRWAATVWARSKLGDPYDTRSLFLIELDRFLPGLRLDNPTANRFSCAVFVAQAYRAAGVDLFPMHRWQDLVPEDFTEFLPDQQHARR